MLVVHGTNSDDLPAGATDWAHWLAGRARGTEVKWVPVKPDTAARCLEQLRGKSHVPEGAHLVVGPLQHNGPLVAVRHRLRGHPVVVPKRFDAAGTLRAIEQYAVASSVMVPTHFQRLLALPYQTRAASDVSSLRMVAHTGAGCPEPVKRAMIDWFGPVLVESYGGSESGTLCRISSDDWLAHPNSVGRPVQPFEVVVLDVDGVELTNTGRCFGFAASQEAFKKLSLVS